MSISPVFFLFQTHHAWTHATYVLVCLLGVLRTQGRKDANPRMQGHKDGFDSLPSNYFAMSEVYYKQMINLFDSQTCVDCGLPCHPGSGRFINRYAVYNEDVEGWRCGDCAEKLDALLEELQNS